jgi:hypothetical protein
LRGGCVIRQKVSGELYTEEAKMANFVIGFFAGSRNSPGYQVDRS